jgi:hypothetical protein
MFCHSLRSIGVARLQTATTNKGESVMQEKKIEDKILKAWKCGVPIVAVETKDPGAFASSLFMHLQVEFNKQKSEAEKIAFVCWDCSKGVSMIFDNPISKAAVSSLGDVDMLADLHSFLVAADKSQQSRVMFIVHNIQFFLSSPGVVQAIYNCRDGFKTEQKTLVLLGGGFVLPPELQNDVIVFDQPLPTEQELEQVISGVAQASEIRVDTGTLQAAGKASVGVTAFAAENLSSLALSKAGLDVDELWRSKARKINETPGLAVASSGSFESIGGVSTAKQFFRSVLSGRSKPNAIVWIDEIEKAMAGVSGDQSGVSQDQLMQLLTWMQEKRARGAILNGPPGAAKSAFAKAAGTEFNIPTIQLDLGGAKGPHVGDSEKMIRDALKVIDAVSDGNTLWLATCNSMGVLPPELRRRFKLGVWFFDLPDLQERRSIWEIYMKRYSLNESFEPLLGKEWTGAEIETCCELAYDLNVTLLDAAEYIVPVMQHSRTVIEGLRESAAGKFLSASYSGTYTVPGTVSNVSVAVKARKRVD